MTEITSRRVLSALPPTEADFAAWHALSREAQLARYREALQAPDAGRVSKATMADVLAAHEASRGIIRSRCRCHGESPWHYYENK
jgi:hypothetical protein